MMVMRMGDTDGDNNDVQAQPEPTESDSGDEGV